MKDYKRLTKYSETNEDYITPYCDTQNCNGVCRDCDYEQVIVNRLAELENKIENGTLIELPCKVGDTLWEAKGNYCGVFDIQVEKIEVFENNDIKILDRYENDYYVEDFGKTLFLTKAEAEKKLEELRGKK